MSLEAIIPWVAGTAVVALTLLEPFPVRYRGPPAAAVRTTLEPAKPALDFYGSIRAALPNLAPPRAVFAIWFVLYLFIAIAHTFWAIHAEPVADPTLYRAIWIVYFVHLFFDKIWGMLFFGMQSRAGVTLGFVDILLVLGLAVAQIVMYISYGAPVVTFVFWGLYFMWIFYATLLSGAIFVNKDKLSYASAYTGA